MICPRCKKDMIVVEYHQIELDYCPSCEGVWFDAGELELLLHSASLDAGELAMDKLVDPPETGSPHKRCKCPICSHAMKETAIGRPEIYIDVCRQGDGLWFDGGELHQLLTQMAPESAGVAETGQPIIGFLKQVFKSD